MLPLLAASSLIITGPVWAREELARPRRSTVQKRILVMGRERALPSKRDFTGNKYIRWAIMTNRAQPARPRGGPFQKAALIPSRSCDMTAEKIMLQNTGVICGLREKNT